MLVSMECVMRGLTRPIVRLSAHLALLGAHHVHHIVRVGQLVGTLQVRGRQAAS